MDILFVTKSLEIGGAEANILDLSVTMKARGLTIGVLVLSRAAQSHLDRLNEAGIPFKIVESGAFGIMLIEVLKTIRKMRPAVVHAHMPLANQVCRFLRPFYRAALITTEHNDWMRIHSLHRKVSWLSSQLDAASLACSQSVADSFPYRLEVNENGRDFDSFVIDSGAISLPQGVSRKYDALFLNVANVNVKKDQALLIEAFAKLPEQVAGRRPVLLIAGRRGDAWNAVSQAIIDKKLADRAFLLGERNDVPALMQAADCMVITSRFEGLPLTLLEGMYLRLPVVSVDVGEIGQVVGQSPWFVSSRKPDHIARAMISAVENPDMAWVDQAYNLTVSRYSVDRQVSDLLKVYERVSSLNSVIP